MSKVSIIVPIYNVEKYIKKCMDSLINQTFSDIEIFAINDGSKDKSGEIAKEYAKFDKRVHYIDKENAGYGSVLELAIERISSQYFIICDPDDWLELDAIEKLYEIAINNNCDITIANKYIVYLNDNNDKKVDDMVSYFCLKENSVYKDDVSKFSFLPVSPHSKLYKTSIAKNIKFPFYTSFTDFLLYAISLQSSENVLYTKTPLSNYLIDRPGNTATDKKPKAVQDHINVWYSIFEQCDRNDKYLIFRLFLEFKRIINVYIRNSNDLFYDDLYVEILKIRNELANYYYKILKIKNIKIKDKILLYCLLKRKNIIKKYIHLKLKLDR